MVRSKAMTTRTLQITISAGTDRCGFCVHRCASMQLCSLFGETLASVDRGAGIPVDLLRCRECLDAERVAK